MESREFVSLDGISLRFPLFNSLFGAPSRDCFWILFKKFFVVFSLTKI